MTPEKPRILHEPNSWTLVESFFNAYTAFRPIYDTYEARVTDHAQRQGTDRRYLRLQADEVAQLLDFTSLEDLRDGALFEFKAQTHNAFRDTSLKNRDKLDRYANELFHNISILKEHQFMVSTFAVHYDQTTERMEYESVLAEVHEEFPTLVHRLHALFEKARERIETMLPKFSKDRVFLRSLFLFGDEVFGLIDAYPGGLEDVLRLVFPSGGPVRGYLEVARSFKQSGFTDRAREAVARGTEAFNRIERKFKESGEDSSEIFQLLLDLENIETKLKVASAPGSEAGAGNGT